MDLRLLIRLGFCAVTCAVILATVGHAQEPTANDTTRVRAVGLAPGDIIEAHFIDFPEANDLHLTVSPEGNLFVPYVGPVKVAGLMPDEAQAAIVQALRNKDVVADPQVALSIVAARNLSAIVVGEVNQPHPIPVFSPISLSSVLSQVGGFTQLANYHVLIAHNNGTPATEVDLDYTFHNLSGMQTEVRPGDIIAVLRANSFYALGDVQKPGMYPIVGSAHLTLLQAIATAGGPTNTAQLSGLRVFRRQKDGTRLEMSIDFSKLSKGQLADVVVQADDIIYFPHSGMRFLYNSWISQSLYAAIIAGSYFR